MKWKSCASSRSTKATVCLKRSARGSRRLAPRMTGNGSSPTTKVSSPACVICSDWSVLSCSLNLLEPSVAESTLEHLCSKTSSPFFSLCICSTRYDHDKPVWIFIKLINFRRWNLTPYANQNFLNWPSFCIFWPVMRNLLILLSITGEISRAFAARTIIQYVFCFMKFTIKLNVLFPKERQVLAADLPQMSVSVSNPPSIMLHLQTLLDRPANAPKPYPFMPTVNDLCRDVVQVQCTYTRLIVRDNNSFCYCCSWLRCLQMESMTPMSIWNSSWIMLGQSDLQNRII